MLGRVRYRREGKEANLEIYYGLLGVYLIARAVVVDLSLDKEGKERKKKRVLPSRV